MQPLENDCKPVCPTTQRAATAYQRYGPLPLLLLLFAAFDFLVPFVAKHIAGVPSPIRAT